MTWRIVFAAHIAVTVILALIGLAMPAHSHGHWNWVMDFRNAEGKGCCHPEDVVPVARAVALQATVGSVIEAEFPNGEEAITVQVIYATQDAHGRPLITKFGCLFTIPGG